MRRVSSILVALALLAAPVAAAPDPPRPRASENLPRVVANFMKSVRNNIALILGLPPAPRGPDFVTRDLLLGPEPESVGQLADLGVDAVLDMRAEKADDAAALEARGMSYKHILVADYHAPTQEQLREGVAWIRAELAQGKRVYVHCAAGVGRSATVVAAFLMDEYGWSQERAWSYLESRRPIVKQTEEQRDALIEFRPRSIGALGALDRGFERRNSRVLGDLVVDRAHDAERDAER
jgi:hypothetical protein